jgi:hypothetical protein
MTGSMKMSRPTAESSRSMRGCPSGDGDGSPMIGLPVTRARIEQALRFMANIVTAPNGEVYLPIFERLERELAAVDAKSDALQRARTMVGAIPRSSPSIRHDA